MATKDAQFVGAIPELYEKHLVPVIFDPFAEDLVSRVGRRERGEILEIACGTGVVTRKLIPCLSGAARLTATDLNEAMLKVAQSNAPASPHVRWQTADGMTLPFDDASFDTVICEFGVMFYPDRARGFREARRVLEPGGEFLFNVWDRFERNRFGRIAHETIARFFEADPPTFYFTPFGFHDADLIGTLLRSAGFRDVKVDHVTKEAVSPSAREFATGLVLGNPVALDIAERSTVNPNQVVDALAEELAREGGDRPHRETIAALVVTARN